MWKFFIIWIVGIVITLPVAIAFCKATKRGDRLNAKIFDEKN